MGTHLLQKELINLTKDKVEGYTSIYFVISNDGNEIMWKFQGSFGMIFFFFFGFISKIYIKTVLY